METFVELNLSEPLNRAVAELGYKKPSPIQVQTLPILLGDATDFIGLAATGTGKTAAFSIPLIEKIDPALKAVQALVLCPTRELAMQVSGQVNLLGKYKGITALPIYGGSGYREQIDGIKRGAQVVVGTPGRVIDHLGRGTLKLSSIKTLILDEADEMISMGFRDELDAVLQKMPRATSNIWLFSVTMNKDVRRVADSYLKKPKQVQVNRSEMLSGTVEQVFYSTKEADKPDLLCKLIDVADHFYGIVFCQTKIMVTDLAQYLSDRGYKVDCLHGDMDQNARERTMQAFRDKKVSLLVCTDVASRGLDVKDITHVINYSLPRELDSYVHRIGRTARSGKKGIAMSLVTPIQRNLVGRIEGLTKSKIVEGKVPTYKEMNSLKASSLLERFISEKSHMKAVEVLKGDWLEVLEKMDSFEVASRFVAMFMPELWAERKPAQGVTVGRSHRAGERRPHREQKYRDGNRPRRGYRTKSA